MERGLYKSGWVCYDIDGRGSIGERDDFVKAGFSNMNVTKGREVPLCLLDQIEAEEREIQCIEAELEWLNCL